MLIVRGTKIIKNPGLALDSNEYIPANGTWKYMVIDIYSSSLLNLRE